MVQIVENWALVIGMVIGILPAEPGEPFATLMVEIERVETVEGFPNLIQQGAGERLAVRVRSEQITAGATGLAGSRQTIRVRRGRDAEVAFAAPEWRPEAQ